MGIWGGELKIINVDVYDVQKWRKFSKYYVSLLFIQFISCLLFVCYNVNEMRMF